jgi:gliding motility-associated-like protein
LPRDLPLITNVSVEKTDPNNGRMEVRWTKPLAKDLDTMLNPGPYRYQLFKAPGLTGGTLQEVPGASFVSKWFKTANDTMFMDQVLDTKSQAYRYQVGFYVRGDGIPIGKTNAASSVFLSIKSTDKTNILSWQENVPWNNYNYEIYRKNPSGQFDLIGTSNTKEYYDRGLANLKEYCYYVRSTGTYSINGIPDPLFNKSQEACGIPIDTIPPCTPTLTVKNACDEPGASIEVPFENNLKWTNPNLNCGFNADAVGYKIWYAPADKQPLILLETIEGATNTGFIHRLTDGLAGCYAVSAIDSVGNESAKSSPLVCKDNCPLYELPNVFTPNGDNQNDLYTPFPNWRFIEKVDFKVFNRWGNLVFSTTDPQLNWTGKDSAGNDLSEGTYLYTCNVFEKRVTGAVLRPDILSGYIELIRGGR